jgi:hypothetical protein
MKIRLLALCLGTGLALGLAGAAHAAYSVSQPLSWWATAGSQTLGDKIFTFNGSSLTTTDPTRTLTVNTYDFLPGSIRVNLATGSLPTSAWLDYTLAVDTNVSPLVVYTGVTQSYSNSIMPPTTITQTYAQSPVVVTNTSGAPLTVAIPGDYNLLTVHVAMSGYWDSTTSMFTSASVPEPGTLAVLGLSVLLLRRRRA